MSGRVLHRLDKFICIPLILIYFLYLTKHKPNEPRRRKTDQNSKKEKRIHTATTMCQTRAIPCTNQSGGEWMGVNKPIQSENDL